MYHLQLAARSCIEHPESGLECQEDLGGYVESGDFQCSSSLISNHKCGIATLPSTWFQKKRTITTISQKSSMKQQHNSTHLQKSSTISFFHKWLVVRPSPNGSSINGFNFQQKHSFQQQELPGQTLGQTLELPDSTCTRKSGVGWAVKMPETCEANGTESHGRSKFHRSPRAGWFILEKTKRKRVDDKWGTHLTEETSDIHKHTSYIIISDIYDIL